MLARLLVILLLCAVPSYADTFRGDITWQVTSTTYPTQGLEPGTILGGFYEYVSPTIDFEATLFGIGPRIVLDVVTTDGWFARDYVELKQPWDMVFITVVNGQLVGGVCGWGEDYGGLNLFVSSSHIVIDSTWNVPDLPYKVDGLTLQAGDPYLFASDTPPQALAVSEPTPAMLLGIGLLSAFLLVPHGRLARAAPRRI